MLFACGLLICERHDRQVLFACDAVSRDKSMQCECNVGYKGHSCEQCDFGFYLAGNYCVPCNCSGNENILVEDFCDADTGCVRHRFSCHY